MANYPETVARIAEDYLERVKAQLRLLPASEQEEFLGEIRSHIYEAYYEAPCEDEVARILAVLRNLGEPVDVVTPVHRMNVSHPGFQQIPPSHRE